MSTRGLEAVVKDQVQCALAEGLKSVHEETEGAVEALQRVKGAANTRVTLWMLGFTAIPCLGSITPQNLNRTD